MENVRGFTLIELMIVVAIIAILAAIAIPAYQAYAIRARLTEGFSIAMGAKADVGTAYEANGTTGIAAVAQEYAPGNASTASKYLQRIEVSAAGVITVVVAGSGTNGIPPSLDGLTFTLTPQLATAGGYVALDPNVRGKMDWACASTAHAVADARGMLYTTGTLEPKYLPSECR